MREDVVFSGNEAVIIIWLSRPFPPFRPTPSPSSSSPSHVKGYHSLSVSISASRGGAGQAVGHHVVQLTQTLTAVISPPPPALQRPSAGGEQGAAAGAGAGAGAGSGAGAGGAHPEEGQLDLSGVLGGARLTRVCPVAALSRLYIVGGTASMGTGGTAADSEAEGGAKQQEGDWSRQAANGSESYLDIGADLDLDPGTGRTGLPESRRLRLSVHDALHDASSGSLSALSAIPMPRMTPDEDGDAGIGGGSVELSSSSPSSSASLANVGRLPQCLRPRRQSLPSHADEAEGATFGADQRHDGAGVDDMTANSAPAATGDGDGSGGYAMDEVAAVSDSAACPSWRVQRYLTGSGTHQGRMVLELQREWGAADGITERRQEKDMCGGDSSSSGGCDGDNRGRGGGGDGAAAGEVCVFQLVPWYVKLWLHTLELRINGQVGGAGERGRYVFRGRCGNQRGVKGERHF